MPGNMIKQILAAAIAMLFFAVQNSIAQKPVKIVQPKTEFDIKQATEMLNEGKSEIKGVAYYEGRTVVGWKTMDKVYLRRGAIASLYPLTKYMEAYLDLKRKNKEGKQLATINQLAACFRIESKVYSDKGEFVFIGLNPGKYYLEAEVTFPGGVGGREVSDVVEIKTDGEVVSCKLNYIYRSLFAN
jgi:hypothetical protein